MARRLETPAPEEIADEIPLTPIQEDNLAIEANIMAAFDADPDNIVWDCRVIKLDRSAGNAEDYLFSVLPNELDGLWDRLRDTEGTGTYRVRVYRKEGGKNRVFKQFDQRIKAPTKATPPAAPQSDLAAVIAVIERNNQRMIDTITAALNRPPVYAQPTAPQNPFEMMSQMATAMGTLMGALRQPEGASTADLVLKGVELANKLERGDKETNLLDVVREAFASLPALVQMTEAQRAALTPPTPALRIPAPTAPAPVATPPNNGQGLTAEAQAQQQMRNAILSLIPKAQKNSTPGLYAELLADEWGLEMVSAVTAQPNLLPSLQLLVPEIGPFLPWFQSLLAELTELVNDARANASGPSDAPGKPSPAVNPLRDTGWAGRGESDTEDYE